jgi:hypothetical protein
MEKCRGLHTFRWWGVAYFFTGAFASFDLAALRPGALVHFATSCAQSEAFDSNAFLEVGEDWAADCFLPSGTLLSKI